ncbi:carboxymuconolactone decarboxylase family protein [Actinomycetospora sp. C-140]
MSRLLDDPLPAGMFSAAEEAVIRYARASTWMQTITDEMWADLRAHFDTKQIVEISFTVGLDQLVSRFHATVHTDVDDTTAEATGSSCAVSIPPPPT